MHETTTRNKGGTTMIVNHGYIRGKTRKAETREIKTTIYNIIRNTEAIGLKTMDYDLLVQRCSEHLEELRLNYTRSQIVEILEEMKHDDILYTVTAINGVRVGLTR